MKAIFLVLVVHTATAATTNVPKTDLDYWNSNDVREGNNCYNYATNRVTDSFAQPGEAAHVELEDLTCQEVTAAVAQDQGITPTPFFPYDKKTDDTLIALVVAPGDDFHWYRRDDSGKWTQKLGPMRATAVDNSGKEITSVETADRGPYTDFCGYFRIKNYITEADEQNGGYVRIGYMGSLPPLTSQVAVMQYSGRRNPSFPLKDYLQNPEIAAQLAALKDHVGIAGEATPSDLSEVSKLGYHGVEIRDIEGLVLPKGSHVQILGNKALAYFGGAMKPLAIKLPAASMLEKQGLKLMGPWRK